LVSKWKSKETITPIKTQYPNENVQDSAIYYHALRSCGDSACARGRQLLRDPPAEPKLTDAQKAQIEQLRKEEHKAIEAVKEDKKLKDADKATKIKAIKEDYKAKIAAVKAGK